MKDMFFKPSGFLIIIVFIYSTRCIAQQTILDQVDAAYVDTLVALAKRNYPRHEYFQARTNASLHSWKAQKLSWLDPLSFSYQYLPNNQVNAVNPVFLNGYQFGLFLNIGSLAQKPALIQKAKQEYNAVSLEQAEYDKNLEAEVKKRYYYYLSQLNMLKLLSKTVLDAEGLVQNISIRYQKSEVSFEEYSKALVTFSGTIQTKLETEANMLTAKSSLEELVGVKLEEISRNGSK